MNNLPILRDVITREAIRECYERVERHLDKRVVHIYDDMRWPGSQKNVVRWWELGDGSAVAWNENPSRGWTFPSMKLPTAFKVSLYKDENGRLRVVNGERCTYQEWLDARESATESNLSGGINMIYSAAKQTIFLRVSNTAPKKTKLNVGIAETLSHFWLRSM